MKVLVTGSRGQLGYDVIQCLKKRNVPCVGADKEEFDITDAVAVERFLAAVAPDVVVHCSAYTAVDRSEEEKELCYCVNVEGTRNIAKVCQQQNIRMVYISTDYVFSGEGDNFYEIDDKKAPLGEYGLTKLLGEEVVQQLLQRYFIIRISWVFGRNGNNFIKTMLRLGKEHKEIRVVCDQIGSPTYTADLAPLICDIMQTEKYGIYHATNEGICSWSELAENIFAMAGMDTKVRRVTTEEYGAKATRPKNSRLSKKSLDQNGFMRLPNWKDALERYLKELQEE